MSARLLALRYLFIGERRSVKHLKQSHTKTDQFFFVVTHCKTELKLGQDPGLLNFVSL